MPDTVIERADEAGLRAGVVNGMALAWAFWAIAIGVIFWVLT